MPSDDNTTIRRVRDARVVHQLRPIVQRAIEWTRDELEPAILRGLARQNPRFTIPQALAFAEGLREEATTKVTRELSEFDRGVFRGAVRRRVEGLLAELAAGAYPEPVR